ncbi:MAG: hypothetical protein ACOY0S_03070 [Patescibacteria group bacterium]
MEKYYKRALKYLGQHPHYNAFIHVLAGMGLGFLLTYPVAGTHPVRWGVAFLVISLLGHLWAAFK